MRPFLRRPLFDGATREDTNLESTVSRLEKKITRTRVVGVKGSGQKKKRFWKLCKPLEVA
jgi:hypothetical protein